MNTSKENGLSNPNFGKTTARVNFVLDQASMEIKTVIGAYVEPLRETLPERIRIAELQGTNPRKRAVDAFQEVVYFPQTNQLMRQLTLYNEYDFGPPNIYLREKTYSVREMEVPLILSSEEMSARAWLTYGEQVFAKINTSIKKAEENETK